MASSLSIDVFNSEYKPIPGGPGWDDSIPATWPASTSTLISGDRDAVLVDALLTTSEGERLAAWLQNTGKQPSVIFVTHGHGDHFFGAGPVLDAFPGAQLVACDQQVVGEARGQTAAKVMASWDSRFAGQLSQSPAVPALTNSQEFRPGRPSPPVPRDRRRRRRARHDRARAGHAGHLLRRHCLQQHPHVAMELHAGLTPGVAGVPGRGGRPQAVHDHHRAQGSQRARRQRHARARPVAPLHRGLRPGGGQVQHAGAVIDADDL